MNCSPSTAARPTPPQVFSRLAVGLCALLVAGQLATVSPAAAGPPLEAPARAQASQLPVNLGTAGTYSVLGGTGVVNTGVTALGGDLGLSPRGAITGFGPGTGTVAGTIHDRDSAAVQAQVDRSAAYNDAKNRTGATPAPGDQIGRTFAPGLYNTGGSFLNTGNMVLDAGGNPDAVFIIQVPAAFSPGAASNVTLAGGAKATNLFWQVDGAVSIGEGSTYPGIFLVNGAITLGDGMDLKGRALSNGTVTLANNSVTEPQLGSEPRPVLRPDAAIKAPGSRLVGVGVYREGARQQVGRRLRGNVRSTSFAVRLQNRGNVADRITLQAPARQASFQVTYRLGGKNVTAAVRRGTFRTALLAPSRSVSLTMIVTRTRIARPGDRVVLRVLAGSVRAPAKRDVVYAKVRIDDLRR
jgi:hypothetical protein